MRIALWHFPALRRGRKTAEVLRRELIARLLGSGHPGFRGKPADIDAHVTVLVDAVQGKHGRALQIAVTAFGNGRRATETLDRLTAKKRGRDRAQEAEAEADVRQWLSIYKASRLLYLAARAVRGEPAIDVLPEGCESPNYLLREPPAGSFHAPVKQPWLIPHAAPVIEPAGELIAASANAVALARAAADAANVLRLARVGAAPVIKLPEACGFGDTEESRESAGQVIVATLERFAAVLENQTMEAA
ncbi:hypothetical protein [Paraburkholderia caledonica]|uniref:hypothetical protein n=1 Tax=Paraburkholderia caledonica TaxID=134536 RepID=UPI0012EBA884|nr:hypothetical protein [Paraburkholderia caledonica]